MKKNSIIILHGWRVKADRYFELVDQFERKGYKVYTPTMPGFDESKIPSEGYTLSDYADFLSTYIKKNKIEKAVLVGHSFGGRVIAKYFQKYKSDQQIEGVVLCGTPLIVEPLTLRKFFSSKIISYSKLFSRILPLSYWGLLRKRFSFLAYRLIGEYDYYKAGDLKKTMINVLADPADSYVNLINVPTLIIWGDSDRITPISIGRSINERVPNSKLIVISGGTHKLPYELPQKFSNYVLEFISSIRK